MSSRPRSTAPASSSTSVTTRKGAIRYALAAIKGVGRQAIEALIEARGDAPFKDLADLARRINPRVLNKRTLENLIAAGALDELEPDRARAMAAVDAMMSLAQQAAEASSGGMQDMFGGVAAADVQLRIPPFEPWPAATRLQKEYDAVGFFLSGHPLDEYGDLLKKLRVQSWVEFCRSVKAGNSVGRVAATVLDRTERRTKTGQQDGHRHAVRSDRPFRGDRLLRRPAAASRHPRARPGRARSSSRRASKARR